MVEDTSMHQSLTPQSNQTDEKLDEILRRVKRIQQYFLWSLVLTIFFFVVPLVGLLFVIPWFLGNYLGSFGAVDSGQMMQSMELFKDLF